MPRPVGINHAAVEVGSIDEALAFFEQLFGELTLRGRSRSMAFVDMGDQFIALSAGRTQPPDGARHIGLVVDGREETLERARTTGARMLADNDFLDPWGNHWQIVDYGDVQFTKTPRILEGMGLEGLDKSEHALEELRSRARRLEGSCPVSDTSGSEPHGMAPG
jgi:predicted enzyme related to lactoylglutathione lyase